MKTVELVVRGNVQRVGYRNFVSQTAFEVGVKGFVENLEDESVKIVVQASRGKIKEFIKRVRVDEWPIVVKSIAEKKIITENTFTEFKIARGEPQKEMLERADEAVLILSKMNTSLGGKMDQNLDETKRGFSRLGRKMDCGFSKLNSGLGNKINTGFSNLNKNMSEGFSNLNASLGGKIDSGFSKLNGTISHKFDRMDKKYGAVSKSLKRIDGNIVNGFKGFNKEQGNLSKYLKGIDKNFKQLNNNLITIGKAALNKS